MMRVLAPFLTETFPTTRTPDELSRRILDAQLAVTVTPSTCPLMLPAKGMPLDRKRCTTPGPRTLASL